MFILSKIIGYFLQPFSWIFLLVIWAYFTRIPERRKKLIGYALILFLFFSNPWIIENLMISYQAKPTELFAQQQYVAGILLGGLVSYDTQGRKGFFNFSSDRFIQTSRLYKLGHIRKIIVSGGNALLTDGGFREADYIYKNLMDLGIPGSDILIERNSKNTIENSRFVKVLADSIQLNDTCLLITSAFHIPRAMGLFKKSGMKVKAFPALILYFQLKDGSAGEA